MYHFERTIELKPAILSLMATSESSCIGKGNWTLPFLLQKGAEIQPNYFEVHYNLGIALREKGQTDEAISAFQNALKLNSGLAGVHRELGVAFEQKDRMPRPLRNIEMRSKLSRKPLMATTNSEPPCSLEVRHPKRYFSFRSPSTWSETTSKRSTALPGRWPQHLTAQSRTPRAIELAQRAAQLDRQQ